MAWGQAASPIVARLNSGVTDGGWSRGRWEERLVKESLLRLVHDLPGSGKGQLINWLKPYFEDVWQWEKNKQYALTP